MYVFIYVCISTHLKTNHIPNTLKTYTTTSAQPGQFSFVLLLLRFRMVWDVEFGIWGCLGFRI